MKSLPLPKIYIILTIFWIIYWIALQFFSPESRYFYDIFAIVLFAQPLYGSVKAAINSKKWNGRKSAVGRILILISLGLFAWSLGQLAYTIISFFVEEVPYPGLPDIFFIFIDPFYSFAMFNLILVGGIVSNIKKSLVLNVSLLTTTIVALTFTTLYLLFNDLSYFETFDLAIAVDLLYSFGSIVVISLVAINIMFSRLGGKMKVGLYCLLAGFVFQYIGDISYSLLEPLGQAYSASMPDFLFYIATSLVSLAGMMINAELISTTRGERE